ncbi:MAG: hypothetical protein HUU32_03830 [Calditrichaceae bacterium]|nr:hypothetical protein [Calditrichia bacterium]NUQ40506.1 hypothetical protein [Calditrichaceae bacterium]
MQHSLLHSLKTLVGLFFLLNMLTGELAAQSRGFTGFWNSTFGHIRMQAERGKIAGSYDDGKVEGLLNGAAASDREILAGNWTEPGVQGSFVFKMLPGNNSFSGRWWKENSPASGEWVAVRMDPEAASRSVSAGEYNGKWDTNFGKMILAVEGTKVTGTFKGKVSEGVLTGEVDEKNNRLNASWQDQQYRGTVVLTMLKGNNGFRGEWWFRDKTYGGDWYGARSLEMGGCISGDCEEGQGIYLWADGSRYEGEWKKGNYHGIGTAYHSNNRVQNEGLWASGVFRGVPLSGDCKNGSGKLKLPGGEIYEGEFKNCEINGKGVMVYLNGDRYEGEFFAGLPSGNGAYFWAQTGEQYRGGFRNGVIHGKGVYTYRDESRYEGRFLNGKRQGTGFFFWPNGERYEGQWNNDQASGEGLYFYKDGDRYNGEIAAGLKSGRGVYRFADGSSLPARWENDRLAGLIPAPSGVEENTSGATLQTAMERIRNNQKFPGPASSIQTLKTGYFIYKISENELAVGGSAADSLSLPDRQREVELSYYIVYAPENLPRADLKAYLENKENIILSEDYKFEQVSNPETRIPQVLDRYRYGLVQTRVHTVGAYFLFSEGDMAAKTD